MKKLVMLATAAMLFTGVAFAHGKEGKGGCCSKDAKKECSKKDKKDCKDMKDCKMKKETKETKTTETKA